jgi:DNA polymerase III delta prime subunit
MLADVYRGRQKALIFHGPPGIGKTMTAKGVAISEGYKWKPERPGTMLGLLEVLRRNAHGGVLVLDDIDTLWDDPKSIDLLKAALDSSGPRYISHTVSPRSGSIARFELKYVPALLRRFASPICIVLLMTLSGQCHQTLPCRACLRGSALW